MKCPASDPGFASHPVHGLEAQLPEIKRVVGLCRSTGGIAVDVGAHIGIWSVELSKHFERVHAFEPVQENFDCLLENIARLRVTAHFAALGNRDSSCELFMPRCGNSGMAYAPGIYSESGRIFNAEMHTLDRYRFREVGLIKIDVEGYEGNVVFGALATIMESRPVVVFEDNGLGQKRYGREWLDPKPMLTDMRYKKALRIRKDEIWIPSP